MCLVAYEPRHEKTGFCILRKQTQISFAVTAKLISVFVFATWIVQYLVYLNPKFQASSHIVWFYSLVCVGPGWKPRRPVFSERGSYLLRMQADPRSTLVSSTCFYGKNFHLTLFQEEQVVSYLLAKEWALNTGELPSGGLPRNSN